MQEPSSPANSHLRILPLKVLQNNEFCLSKSDTKCAGSKGRKNEIIPFAIDVSIKYICTSKKEKWKQN